MTEHVTRFNEAVRSGDWATFVAAFHPDAVMTFAGGPPVGPFVGRDAILDAYREGPPLTTMRVVADRSPSASLEVVDFQWASGGIGTYTIHRDAGLITRLDVEFT